MMRKVYRAVDANPTAPTRLQSEPPFAVASQDLAPPHSMHVVKSPLSSRMRYTSPTGLTSSFHRCEQNAESMRVGETKETNYFHGTGRFSKNARSPC